MKTKTIKAWAVVWEDKKEIYVLDCDPYQSLMRDKLYKWRQNVSQHFWRIKLRPVLISFPVPRRKSKKK